jgi:hypothetical protein
MKKFIITLLANVMLLTGCGTTYSYDNDVYLDKFVNIETRYGDFDGNNLALHIVYDYDTKVMYYIWDGYESFAFSPIYNADGSVMVYEGE